MSIVITGATGQLGRHVISCLLRLDVQIPDIVAAGRNEEKLGSLAELDLRTARIDYDDPASLDDAFEGAGTVLMISGSEVGRRVAQHTNAIEAAKDAGVGLIAYTSILKADTSSLLLAEEHLATEKALAGSGIAYVLLRNGWYIENYTGQLPVYLEHGIAGAAGDGQVSAATRADYAEAAAAVLAGDGHAGAVYELGGEPFTMTGLADAVSAATGRTVSYTDLPVEQYAAVLVGAGLPEPVAAVFADGDRGVAEGELFTDGNDLEKLIGRAPTSLTDALTAATRA